MAGMMLHVEMFRNVCIGFCVTITFLFLYVDTETGRSYVHFRRISPKIKDGV